nr:unnamed protein product [Callosobruchus analis]
MLRNVLSKLPGLASLTETYRPPTVKALSRSGSPLADTVLHRSRLLGGTKDGTSRRSHSLPPPTKGYQLYHNSPFSELTYELEAARPKRSKSCVDLDVFKQENHDFEQGVRYDANYKRNRIRDARVKGKAHKNCRNQNVTEKTLKTVSCKQRNDLGVICVDYMQNLQLPLIPVQDVFYLTQLTVSLFCIHDMRSDKSYFYINPENAAAKSPNEVCSFLAHFL